MSLNTKCTQEPIQPAAHRLCINKVPKGLQKKSLTKDREVVILFALIHFSLPRTKDRIYMVMNHCICKHMHSSLAVSVNLVPGRDTAVLTKSSDLFTSKKVALQPGRRLTPFSYTARASYLHIYNLTWVRTPILSLERLQFFSIALLCTLWYLSLTTSL